MNQNNESNGIGGWRDLDVTRQNQFNAELRRFGWGTLIGWEYWKSHSNRQEGNKTRIESTSGTKAEWDKDNAAWKIANPGQGDMPTLDIDRHLFNHYHHVHLQNYSPTLIKKED